MSIQTTFNKSIQGTNNVYGDIISNDDATYNNININGKIHQTNSSLTNNFLGRLTVGNSTDQRGVLTNNFNSTSAKTTDTDITDGNRPFCNDNVTTNTSTNNLISGICLQINPFSTLTNGRAIGDIMLVRENNTTSSFMLSAFQGNNYRDLMKIAFSNSFLRGGLNIGSTNTSYSDKLVVEGTTMVANIFKMNNVSPIPIIASVNDVIQWVSGTVHYWANSINTSTHTSSSITHKVDTIFNNLQATYQRKALLSSSGLLQHYSSWTTLLNVSNLGTTTYVDIGNNTTFPYFDNTNYKKHIIHFQGYISGGNTGALSTPKWTIRLYGLVNNVVSTDLFENSINQIERTAPTTLVSLDSSNTNNYAVIMTDIEVTDTYDFVGTITLNNTFSGYQEIKIDCCYNKSSIGSTYSFGSIRNQTKNTIFNGIQLYVPSVNTSHRMNIRYYIESS